MKVVKLQDISEIIRGVTFSKEDTSDKKSDGTVPVLRAGNINGQLLLDQDLVFVDQNKIGEKQYLRRNDIIICTSSGSASVLGKSAVLKEDWIGSFGAFCATVRVNPCKANPKYISYYLKTPEFRRWASSSDGIGIKNIRSSELKDYAIPLPSKEDQERIATILEQANDLRHARRKSIDRLNDLSQAIFYEIFGDAVFEEKNNLSDAIDVRSTLVDPKIDGNQGLAHIGPEHIFSGSGEIDYAKVRTAAEDGITSGKYFFDESCVLYSKIRPYLNKVAIPEISGLCSADMYALEAKDQRATREFIKFLLMTPQFLSYCATCSGRANIPKINRGQLLAFNFSLPSYSKQEIFSSRVNSIKNHKKVLEGNLLYADNLFNSLQKRAFSGEL